MKKDAAVVEKASMSNPSSLCWSCSTAIQKNAFFCDHCDIIQPASGISVFELFELEPCFELDEAQLEQRYFNLQHQLHPDRFAGKTGKEKLLASQQSMAINDAYNILNNPLERANYLTLLMGGKSYKDENNRAAPPHILMNVMEQREALALAQDNDQLERLLKQSQNKQQQIYTEIKTAFENKDVKSLENHVLSLQYEQKFMQEINQKMK